VVVVSAVAEVLGPTALLLLLFTLLLGLEDEDAEVMEVDELLTVLCLVAVFGGKLGVSDGALSFFSVPLLLLLASVVELILIRFVSI
jgi:hypothetical protein